MCSLIRHPPCGRRRLTPSPRGRQTARRDEGQEKHNEKNERREGQYPGFLQGKIPAPTRRRGTLKSKRALPAGSSAAQRRLYCPLFPHRAFLPFASAPAAPGVQGNTPAALFPRFLSRKRNRAAGGLVGMGLTGFLVVANLTGCASAVAVRAANACLRSIAPPLQIEASASI